MNAQAAQSPPKRPDTAKSDHRIVLAERPLLVMIPPRNAPKPPCLLLRP